ncbi:PepSY domain-containing protein [Acidimangrovimonas sediminis]|uniref:PepSY domain-containing protein n=1 Tax=Acidimangrovimonas sediminis TaxID=2056283 RepID=UPI000C80921B|nr:PepSY domain-containing protein [Acidimangrovimonas sediminis]
MKRNLILAAALAGIALPALGIVSATAQSVPQPANRQVAEAQMAVAAPVTLSQAGGIALKAAPGTLAAIGFNDENGKGVYEASVVRDAGKVTLVKVDAESGKVMSTTQATAIGNDHEHGDGQEAEDGAGDHAPGTGQIGDGDGEQQDG